MGKAFGSNAEMRIGFPPSYGAIMATCRKIPFVSTSLGASQGLDENPEIGNGREPAPTTDGAIDGQNRNIATTVDLNNIYYFLRLLCGDPVVTNNVDDYTYTFISGKALVDGYIETGFPLMPEYVGHLGIKMESMSFPFQREGTPQINMVVHQQGEDSNAASQVTATLPDLARLLVSSFQGAIKMDGTQVASVQSGELTIANGLDPDLTIRSDGKVDGYDDGVQSAKGRFQVRYQTGAVKTAVDARTAVELEFSYQINATQSLIITVHEVKLPKPITEVSGPGGINVTYDFSGEKDSGLGKSFTIELKNQIADYTV
ncbi:MAG: hypothetical protein COB49_00485 [Alphaproteobacteria bacterium]|nr:MAG: hypothetical protein COB49_00485 [Alphaproteobacteria bacterium]